MIKVSALVNVNKPCAAMAVGYCARRVGGPPIPVAMMRIKAYRRGMQDSARKDTSLFTFAAGWFVCSWGWTGITRSVA